MLLRIELVVISAVPPANTPSDTDRLNVKVMVPRAPTLTTWYVPSVLASLPLMVTRSDVEREERPPVCVAVATFEVTATLRIVLRLVTIPDKVTESPARTGLVDDPAGDAACVTVARLPPLTSTFVAERERGVRSGELASACVTVAIALEEVTMTDAMSRLYITVAVAISPLYFPA